MVGSDGIGNGMGIKLIMKTTWAFYQIHFPAWVFYCFPRILASFFSQFD